MFKKLFSIAEIGFSTIAKKPARTLVKVDVFRQPKSQPTSLHNRWHPQIPPIGTVNEGEVFRLQCLDCTGGQIKNNDSIIDIETAKFNQVHYLSGPVKIEGAEPGDLLQVDILDIGALLQSPWGFTGIFSKEGGGGFLCQEFPKAAKAIWDIQGKYATSRHIPHVKLAGKPHPGIIGCAPSIELLKSWNERESKLFATNPKRVPPLALLPNEDDAFVGQLAGQIAERVKKEGLRTIPPRENGGNCDIKDLSIGSKVFLPVYVNGGLLSVGDLHFCQGDGEIAFCGAIQMAGWIQMKIKIIKNGVKKYSVKNPIFQPGPFGPQYSDWLTFEGISVDSSGTQHYMDTNIAYKMACLNAINYLKNFGYTSQQAYILLSCAPIEGRISGIVDIPNACCTVSIPTGIFDFDIKPK